MGLWGVNWIQWKALMEAIDYIKKNKEILSLLSKKIVGVFLKCHTKIQQVVFQVSEEG